MLCSLVHPGLDQGHPSHLSSANGVNQWLEGGKRGACCPQQPDPYQGLKATMLQVYFSQQWMLPSRFLLLLSNESMCSIHVIT